MNEDLTLSIDDLFITKDAESCYRNAYPDPASPLGVALQKAGLWYGALKGATIPSNLLNLSGAPWTIGFGHTGPEVHYGLLWSQTQCDEQLVIDAEVAEANVRKVVTIRLTQEMFIALCDLCFNIGNKAFNESTLLAKLNAHDIQGAADEFDKWCKAAGKTMPGLQKRRDADTAEFTLGANYAA